MAIVPRLEKWLTHKARSISFYITQIMTGHGCFGRFLCRIGKRPNRDCDFCGEEDDAMHTLRECPAWDPQRIILKRKLELPRDFTLGDVVDSITESKEAWLAFSAYAEKVIREKEEEERRRERIPSLNPRSSGDDGSE